MNTNLSGMDDFRKKIEQLKNLDGDKLISKLLHEVQKRDPSAKIEIEDGKPNLKTELTKDEVETIASHLSLFD
jgi:hypothetical protein